MNPFESTLVAALEAEVQETAMSVDATRAEEKLEARLDSADRSRRRRYWAVGAAAAVVVVVAIVVAVTNQSSDQGGRPLPAQTPSPSSVTAAGQPYATTGFTPPFSVTLPPWAAGVTAEPSPSGRFITWQQSACNAADCVVGADVKLRFLIPSSLYEPGAAGNPVPMPDYEGYLAYVSSLGRSGSLSITGRTESTVGGKPAMVFDVTTSKVVDGGLGCEDVHATQDECFGWDPVIALRMAVVDTGSTGPLLIWTKALPDNPQRASYEAQFDQMLTTITFPATPSP